MPEGVIRVLLSNQQPDPVDVDLIRSVVERACLNEQARGEVSVTIVDSPRMAELNRQHMGEDGPTDVLSFPIDGLVTEELDVPVMIGEVVICPQLTSDIELITAHGVLHLLGYDHDTESGAAEMRSRERMITGREGARAS